MSLTCLRWRRSQLRRACPMQRNKCREGRFERVAVTARYDCARNGAVRVDGVRRGSGEVREREECLVTCQPCASRSEARRAAVRSRLRADLRFIAQCLAQESKLKRPTIGNI